MKHSFTLLALVLFTFISYSQDNNIIEIPKGEKVTIEGFACYKYNEVIKNGVISVVSYSPVEVYSKNKAESFVKMLKKKYSITAKNSYINTNNYSIVQDQNGKSYKIGVVKLQSVFYRVFFTIVDIQLMKKGIPSYPIKR